MNKHKDVIILAPIKGFTDYTYRNCLARHFSGIDYAIAPFISTMGNRKINKSVIKGVTSEHNRNLTVIPQLLSNNADDFIFYATHLAESGHTEINWNLGCPHQKIAKKKRGSGLLADPGEIDRILDCVIPKIPCKLSIKTRLGRYREDEIYQLMKVYNRYPLTELIIHPRTGVQMYEGSVDTDMFEAVSELSVNPVVYNGDITSISGFNTLKTRFPYIRRWMIGRGVMSNPFLAELMRGDFEDSDPDQLLKRVIDFHTDLYTCYLDLLSGPSHVMSRMKGLWYYLSILFEGGLKVHKKITKIKKPDQYLDFLETFFQTAHFESFDRPLNLNTQYLKHLR